MKKIMFLIVLVGLFSSLPFLAQSEESGVSVRTPGGSFEVKTGSQDKAPDKMVIVERTTVGQPRSGCGCSLDSGAPCK